jgi:hypothetical protein
VDSVLITGSRHRDTGFSANRKPVAATSPESVYSQRMFRNFTGWKEGSAWAARPTPRLRRPLDWLDTQDGHHAVRPPGSRSISFALNIWRSHGSTNWKPAREERAPPHRRNNPAVTRHQATNGRMLLAEHAPDLMQRLPCLPTTPHVALLLRRKPKPSPLFHKHHL